MISDCQATDEAKDNVKFLNTLERYLRLICQPPTEDLQAFHDIQEALPPLMEALRLVWVLSSYYSQDDHMGNLLQHIGAQLGLTLHVIQSSETLGTPYYPCNTLSEASSKAQSQTQGGCSLLFLGVANSLPIYI